MRMFSKMMLAGLMGLAMTGFSSAASAEAIESVRVGGKGPILSVGGDAWKKAKPVTVAMQGQTVAMPTHPDPAVKEMTVRSVHNGEWVAVLLEWSDATKSDRVVTDRFGDQVAVELPVKAGDPPSVMMGNPGGRVNLLQWRAVFQSELDAGKEISVKDLYPNAPPADIDYHKLLPKDRAVVYDGAKGMGNPVSVHGKSPVLDQVAEGFGTLTVKGKQEANGKGVHKNGKWQVVITAPLKSADAGNGPQLAPGQNTVAAFAVWDGGGREVGSRKAWSDWVTLNLAK